MSKMKINVAGKESSFDYNKIPENTQEKLVPGKNIKTLNKESILGEGDMNVGGSNSFVSLERLDEYLFKITFDRVPKFADTDDVAIPGCSSFVKNGKLYRNLDYNYDNTASFFVKCKEFEGMAFVPGVNDGELNLGKLGQLPYHLYDGCNKHGIRVSAHLLFNDWSYTGCGSKSVPLYTIPYYILKNLTDASSSQAVEDAISDYLANISIPDTLIQNGYLFHFLVTDGTHTYAIEPPETEGESYVVIEMTPGVEQLTNFRYIGVSELEYNDSRLQERPTGIERWNLISTGASLDDIKFTDAYKTETKRISEFIGINETTKESTEEELEAVWELAHNEYENRKRDGKTWQTIYSVVYGPNGIEELYSQENFEKNHIVKSSSGAGLEPGTEAGQGLVWTGSEWKKQSGYGYYVDDLSIEFDGNIDGRYHVVFEETGSQKFCFVKVSDNIIAPEIGDISKILYDGIDMPEPTEVTPATVIVTNGTPDSVSYYGGIGFIMFVVPTPGEKVFNVMGTSLSVTFEQAGTYTTDIIYTENDTEFPYMWFSKIVIGGIRKFDRNFIPPCTKLECTRALVSSGYSFPELTTSEFDRIYEEARTNTAMIHYTQDGPDSCDLNYVVNGVYEIGGKKKFVISAPSGLMATYVRESDFIDVFVYRIEPAE